MSLIDIATTVKKLLLLTFDYELFLGGKSGTVQECMISPTDKILHLLKQYRFKGVFFVDTVYLMKLKTVAETYDRARKDQLAIYEQLRNIVQQGHYIFPHIHAHWLDAEYLPEENEWSLNELRFYRFAALSPRQQTSLFDDSVEIIRSLTNEVTGNYIIDSYRAGGWSIQPFSAFKPHFLRHGIQHEWSVIPGKYVSSSAHFFDFRKVSLQKPIYQFNDDICENDNKGNFKEWTISVLPLNGFEKWLNFKMGGFIQRFGKKEELKGFAVPSEVEEESDVYGDKNSVRMIASFEGLNPYNLTKYLSLIKKASYFHFISHPKLITAFEFRMAEKLFKALSKLQGLETDFRKVSE